MKSDNKQNNGMIHLIPTAVSKLRICSIVKISFKVCALKAPMTTANRASTAPQQAIFLFIILNLRS